MATGKALGGKSHVENPHVRLDERECASAATPRRGAMLYRRLIALMLSIECLSAGVAWGRQIAVDLRAPQPVARVQTAAKLAASSSVKLDGSLRKVNLDAGAADVGEVAIGDKLTFTLFDDVTITLTLKKKMPSPLGGEVFIAEASGYDGVKNAVVLRTAEGLTVDVQDYRNRKVYRVISTATGVMVQEMEAKGGKCGCDALDPPNLTDKASTKLHKVKKVVAAKNVESDETCVDILVAYDTNAATWANANGGGVTNFAQMAVQRMNTVLVNNGLDWAFRFRLVGIAQVSTSSANLDSTLDAATNGSGDWAPIKAKRDDVGADIVTVLIDTGTAYGTTGLGWSLRTTDFESFAESAYNVCAIRSVAQSHTMTHEVGHNMGCGHSDEMADRSNCGPQLYDYSAGCYITEWFPVEEGSEWSSEKKLHTIMAYDDNGYGDIYEEIPYFSSAEKQYTCNGKSVVVGDETHDNTRTLENTYAAVAKWRAQKTPMTYEIRFEPASGTTFEDSVKVTLASTKADAEIRYTLDGSEPTADSVLYSGTITLTDSTTIRAVAVVDGVCGFPYEAAYTKSTLASAIGGDGLTWTFSDDLAWSVYDLPYPESYDLPDYPSPDGLGIRAVRHGPDDAKTAWLETEITGPCDISFFDLFAGAESMSIYLDGDEIPGTGRVSLSYGKCHWGEPTVVNVPAGNHTVKIVITIDADGWWDYTSDGEQYVILDGFMVHRVSAPVLSPATSDNKDYATTFQKEQRVSISSPSDMALIYYTLDGSDPGGESGILYDGPLFINKTTTVKAVAMEPGQDTPSVIATGLYIEKTPLPPPKPGEWTGDAESAFDAAEKDGKMVAVLCMNYAGCMWSQALEPVLRDASFLSWAKANGVYLVNTDDGWLDGDAASSDYFWDLYNDSPLSAELDGYVYYPTFCFASPSDRNVCLGAMLARNDGEHTANGIAYEDTPESLIACFASMLGKMPLGAPVATVTEGQVTLVNTNGTGTLYYTLDGSAPTRERGMIYGGAVTVPVGATLQAVVWPDDVDDVSGITFTYENEDFGMKMGIPGMIWQNDDQHPWKTDGTGRVSIDGTNVSKLVVRVSSPGVISFQMGYHYGGDIELSVNGTEIGCCDAWSRVSQEIENPDGGEITWTFKPSAWCDAPEAWLNELKWSPLPDSPIVRAEGGSVNYGTLIRWDDVYGAIKYLVYRATVNDTSAAVKVAETTQCRFWDSDSKDGSKYWYWVKTVNDYGESNFSMGILAGVRSISVSFDANGGSGIMATQMFVGDVAQALAKNTFTREGYVFLGWTTSAGGEVVYMDGQDLAVVSDMTLYAVWEMANLAAFTIEDGVLTDVKLNGATVIAIPDGVSAIADNVFAQLRGLKGVTIPDGVTSIGSSAFWCAGLMNVTIPDSVTSIGSCAFSWCESLGSATIGNGVTSIGYCMFENCSKLVNVTLPETLRSIESGAFYRCTSLRNIKIPAGMAYIDDTAFSGCINLTVHAPSTLRDTFSVPATCTIEYYDVPEYTVTFNANGGTLGEGVLTQIAVPQGQAIREMPVPTRLFYNFAGWFTSKTGGDRITEETILSADATLYAHWTSTADGWEWEYYDNGDGTVTVYDSVDFYNTPTSIEFPAEINGKPVVAIENNCGIRQMWEPTTISIPASVKRIGSFAFAGYQDLNTVIFLGDESQIEIDPTAFIRTDYIRNSRPFKIIADTYETEYVVGYQGRPETIISADWPEGVSTIFDSSFAYLDSVKKIVFPDGMKELCNFSFHDCENLEEIVFNDDLEIIGPQSFDFSRSLKEVTVPSSVTNVGVLAFARCTSLKKAYLPETLRGKLPDNVFEECSADLEVIYYEVDEPPALAVWTVMFDANGGTAAETSRVVTNECAVGELPVATWDGHTFEGWFTASDGGSPVSDETVVTTNVTYYAHWTAVVVPPVPGPEPDPEPVYEVEFAEGEVAVNEGETAAIRVTGGSPDAASSVKVYITYNTATAADLSLGKTKYPVTLKWAKGDLDAKTVSIPIKKDALVEGEEFFTLQLAAANGVERGMQTVCTVRIADAQERVAPAGATVFTNAEGAVTGYFTKKKGNVTAKAMPGYVFTGWVYTKNGKTYSTKATITDKLRKSKKVQPKFAVAHYLRGLADPANGGKVTGSGLYAAGKKVTLKATPNKNWTFEGWRLVAPVAATSAAAPAAGYVSKAKSLTVAVTNELTYLALFKPYPKVTVAVDNKSGGTVKGAGSYLAGKTVTLTTTPKKGYAFCGWFDAEGNLVTLNASYKYKVTADGLALSASFKKEGALAKPALTWDATNLTVGVSYSAKLSVVGESLVSVTKVTGLPKGLTFKSGKVSGVPTVAKAMTAKVTVALKSNAKKTWTYSVKLNVSALPTWAVGTFKGTLYDGSDESVASPKGTVTLTVGKTGKISGKFVDLKKKSYSFTVASFKSFEDGVLRTKATMKYGKKTVTVEIAVGQDGETSVGFAEVGSTAAPFSGQTAVLAK